MLSDRHVSANVILCSQLNIRGSDWRDERQLQSNWSSSNPEFLTAIAIPARLAPKVGRLTLAGQRPATIPKHDVGGAFGLDTCEKWYVRSCEIVETFRMTVTPPSSFESLLGLMASTCEE